MHSTAVICNCKQVTYGIIEEAMYHHNDLSDVVQLFDEVQKETSCSTGCGGCHSRILDIIADLLNKR